MTEPPLPRYPPHAWRRETGLLERTVLDGQVRGARQAGRTWPATAWAGPLAVLLALIGLLILARQVLPANWVHGHLPVALTVQLAAEAILVAGIVVFARPGIRQHGGYRAAIGLGWVSRHEWTPWITGVGIVLVARFAVGVFAAAFTKGRAAAEASNIHLTHPTAAEVIALGVVAVVVAPVTEEVLFRGILLRAAMQRLPFWPAAVLVSMVFAGLHAYEVATVAGALTLVSGVGVLGLANCYLVRITGRLAPGIMVHATFNLLALVLALARSH